MSHPEQTIRQLVETWHEATAAGDVPRVLILMTEDAVFLSPGQPPLRGQAAFGEKLRALLKVHCVKSAFEIQEIQVAADMAYVWTRLAVTIAPRDGGPAMRRAGDALTVLRRQSTGAWRVVRDANLLVGEPVPQGVNVDEPAPEMAV